jgi:O-antigen/teichoic acid export membrane protein
MESSGRIALLIAGLNFSVVLPMGVFSSVLIAIERYDVLNAITVIGELIRCALVVTVIKMGYGLAALAGVTLLTTTTQYITIALVAKSLYPSLKVALSLVNWTTIRGLFGFGVFRFVVIVANQLIFYSDSLVIGFFLGAAAITTYAVAGSLVNMGRNFVLLITDTFVPAAARLDASRDVAGLRRLLTLGTRMALLIALPLCLGFIFLGKQFLILWMGRAFASSAVILSVLTIPQFSSMSQYVSISVLSAMAKHKILAYVVMAEGIANLVMSIILVRKIGLIGVAWGTVIPHVLTTAVIMPFYTLRVLRLNLRAY